MVGCGYCWMCLPFAPKVEGKCKVIKFSHNSYSTVKPEYAISFKWPKGATGLLLRPKAYFQGPKGDCYIMHKYDGTICDIFSQFTTQEKIEAIYQLCQGITTLHTLGIAHCDIHLANIFYDRCKKRFDIGDFGHAKTLENLKDPLFTEINEVTEFLACITNGYTQQLAMRDCMAVGFNCTSALLIIDFISGVNKDIQGLKESIESLLIGKGRDELERINNGYRQRLNIIEDILSLGFDLQTSRLILDFMNNTPMNAQEIVRIFAEIKNRLQKVI